MIHTKLDVNQTVTEGETFKNRGRRLILKCSLVERSQNQDKRCDLTQLQIGQFKYSMKSNITRFVWLSSQRQYKIRWVHSQKQGPQFCSGDSYCTFSFLEPFRKIQRSIICKRNHTVYTIIGITLYLQMYFD